MSNIDTQPIEEILAEELPPKRVPAVTKKIARALKAQLKAAPTPAAALTQAQLAEQLTPETALSYLRSVLSGAAPKRAKRAAASKTAAAPEEDEASASTPKKGGVKATAATTKKRTSKKAAATKRAAIKKAGSRSLPSSDKSASAQKKLIYWALYRKHHPAKTAKPEDAALLKEARDADAELVRRYNKQVKDRIASETGATPTPNPALTKPAVPAPAPEVGASTPKQPQAKQPSASALQAALADDVEPEPEPATDAKNGGLTEAQRAGLGI